MTRRIDSFIYIIICVLVVVLRRVSVQGEEQGEREGSQYSSHAEGIAEARQEKQRLARITRVSRCVGAVPVRFRHAGLLSAQTASRWP